MAEAKNFPMLPISHWWALRNKFKQSIPGIVTDNFLSSVLKMTKDSARANVLPYLIRLGLIDDTGKPTERAKAWRDDIKYTQVCKEIVSIVYPKELLDIISDDKIDRNVIKRWFANHTGSGESECNRMVSFFTLLFEANPNGSPDKPKTITKPITAKNTKSSPKSTLKNEEEKSTAKKVAEIIKKEPETSMYSKGPEVCINLQIHISADASADQIDQMFAAMAKHIYKHG